MLDDFIGFGRGFTRSLRAICFVAPLLIGASAPASAVEGTLGKVLPVPACAQEWNLDEKVTLYDKDTLFDRIDGEAELYFPYGFELLASARYANRENPRIAVDADVYRMGSLLDAFGIFASYRRNEDVDVTIGAEGTVSSSELLFYQGRYFVRLQATGTTGLPREIFLACGRAISRNLPEDTSRPSELKAFAIPGVVRKSERYVAQSVLGYDFFRRGLMADAVQDGASVQLFLVPEDSGDAASSALNKYRAYLQRSGTELRITATPGGTSLAAVDPLYGNVFAVQSGRFIVGAVRIKDPAAARKLVDRLQMGAGGD
jgi:hypothetical protein